MDIKNWFVPTMSFVLFLYFMLFIFVYIIKIGSADIKFYDDSGVQKNKPVDDAGKFLQDISKNFK